MAPKDPILKAALTMIHQHSLIVRPLNMVVVLMDLLEHEDQNTKAVKRLHHAKILCGVAVTTLYIRAMGPIRKAVV
jgi:ABC-type enterobactin transport system permease subunit